MSFITAAKTVFGMAKTNDTVKMASHAIIEGLDNLKYADQEQAQDSHKAAEAIIALQKSHVNENGEQSKARRYLAKLTFWHHFLLTWLLIFLYKIDPAWSKEALAIVISISSSLLVLMVAGVYFVPHQFSKLGLFTKKEKS